jgi:CheY-like chemotaxis protein
MKKGKVLIVDDDFVQFLSTELLLRIWGYEVLGPASSSEEALEIAEKDKPDVVLMDINIQGNMDGIDTARQIADQFKIPVIFTTGYDRGEVCHRLQKVESAAILTKPYELDELKSAIEQHTKA